MVTVLFVVTSADRGESPSARPVTLRASPAPTTGSTVAPITVPPPRAPSIDDLATLLAPEYVARTLPNPNSLKFFGGMSADGAVSVNRDYEDGRRATWMPLLQRVAVNEIVGGYEVGEHAPVDRGWKMLDWAFSHQRTDGSLADAEDAFHGGSFLLADSAAALLFIREAAVTNHLLASSDLSRYAALKPKVVAYAKWLGGPAWRAGREQGMTATHRRFLEGAAVGLAGRLGGDRVLIDEGYRSILDGVTDQVGLGMLPELGGPDTGYQMIGLAYAERWLAFDAHVPAAPTVAATIAAGLAWERGHLSSDGTLDVSHNTRTNGQELTVLGAPKGVDFGFVAEAFCYWGIGTNSAADIDACDRISARYVG